ncbi:MAG: septum formation initiator family protein [Candidatus Jorgensenbacteria bacterium]
MNWWRIIIIAVIIVVLGLGIYSLIREKSVLGREVAGLRSEFQKLEKENRELTSRIEYFANPENLLKEIKSQFNYREQGEGLIIIVPNKTATE